MKTKYEINDVVWFISGTGSILPARIRNIITTVYGNPVTYRDNYQVGDKYMKDRTVVTYDLGNDLVGMAEDKLFASAEDALKSIRI